MSETQTIYGWLEKTPANKFFDTYIKGALDISGGYIHLRDGDLIVAEGDASFNGKVLVKEDVSLNANLYVSQNMGINTTPNNDIVLDINATNALRLPKGTNEERPIDNSDNDPAYKGIIRYNTEQDQFEGYGAGNAWGSLGGVKDVDQDTYITAETAAGADNDQIQFYTAGIERMIIDASGDASFNHGVNIVGSTTMESTLRVEGYIGINAAPNSEIVLDISATNALRLPKGNNEQRPIDNSDDDPAYKGIIRYNTEQDQFEGYGAGNAWGSLGGVKDVDQDTYITAETAAGADNDQIQFYTAGIERMIIDASGDASFNHGVNIVGSTTMESTLRVEGYIGINAAPNSEIVLDISATNALRLPKGNNEERPIDNSDNDPTYKGIIRYNTEQDQFEGYGAGNAWGSLGGVKDVDQDTYITAETAAGADNDQLQFYTVGAERMIIDASGDASFNHKVNIVGAVTMQDTLEVDGDVSFNSGLSIDGSMVVKGDLFVEGNLAVFQTTDTMTINTTVNNYEIIITNDLSLNGELFVSGDVSMNGDVYMNQNVGIGTVPHSNLSLDISSNSGIRVPHGTDAQRPDASGSTGYGIIRYSTENQGFEGYGMGGWSGLGGVKDTDGDTTITAEQGGVDTDVLSFITNDVERMALSTTDLSINIHVLLQDDASLNGVVDMGDKLNVAGDVSLNSHLFVANDVSFNENLKVYGAIDVSSGITAFTSNVWAQSFTAGTVEQFDIGEQAYLPIAAGNYYVHFESGLQVTGDISHNNGRTVQF